MATFTHSVMNICDALLNLFHMYNLKNVKNIHGGVLLLVQLQEPATLLKVTLLQGCFFMFFKLYKWYQITQYTTYTVTCLGPYQMSMMGLFVKIVNC